MRKEHTKGPWAYGEERENQVEPTHRQVTAPHTGNGPIRKQIATVYYGETKEERLANAALIAAAPELLKAVELLEAYLFESHEHEILTNHGNDTTPCSYCAALEQAREVIAKAKGGAL